ncbi:SPOR domain-containing protein [Rhodohalobacter sp.]|uniref:SPOR domain-containing protein n=1 Tax=Rhodohalobacter sp. TaxID=1974210 RepID=UPI002ACE226D|nr:SPOR domain-containing protein [Rhodohalobacter sp.]MDZ7757371.1 SPOR domain-containing protein [Rhodohalobacter sp.]
MKKLILSLLFFPLLLSCSTTESVTEDDDRNGTERSPYLEISDEALEEFALEELDEFERTLYLNRTRLTDRFATIQHDMPELFTREVAVEERETDQFAGYRVQILSTRDVIHADTTRDNFVAWSDTTMEAYKPNAYIHFRQPYYRVQAGDFQNREKAIEFSRLIKQQYPEAWVVHDRIEPQNVPADTTTFRFREIINEVDPESEQNAQENDIR